MCVTYTHFKITFFFHLLLKADADGGGSIGLNELYEILMDDSIAGGMHTLAPKQYIYIYIYVCVCVTCTYKCLYITFINTDMCGFCYRNRRALVRQNVSFKFYMISFKIYLYIFQDTMAWQPKRST